MKGSEDDDDDDGLMRRRLPLVVLWVATSFSMVVVVSASVSSWSKPSSPPELDSSRATYVTEAGSHPPGSDLVAHSGGDASQTGKHTWAASDPVGVAEWWLEMLPTSARIVGNDTSDGECATYGKVFVGNETSTGLHGVNAPFQLHAVRAWARPSGPLSISELEARFGRALERWGVDGAAAEQPLFRPPRRRRRLRRDDEAYALHALAPLAENHVALYTEDLASYARAFSTAGAEFGVLAWDGAVRGGTVGEFHSLVVHVPDSLIVLELVGPKMEGRAAERATPSWRRIAAALPPASHVATRDLRGRPSLTVVKLSYATTDAARDAAWAEQVLSMTTLDRTVDSYPPSSFDESGGLAGSAAFGVVARALSWTNDVAPVEVHYVQPADAAQSVEAALAGRGSPDEPALAVASYEAYASSVHATHTGPKCDACDDVTGFDRLMDTHFGRRILTAGGTEARTLDDAYAAAKNLGAPLTLWRKNDAYFLYVASPSGAAAQLTGTLDAPPTGVRVFDTCLV